MYVCRLGKGNRNCRNILRRTVAEEEFNRKIEIQDQGNELST